MFKYRAILFAQTLHPEWEKKITPKMLPISYFAENDYFIGCGSKNNKRLSLRAGLAAIEWVCDARNDGKKYALEWGVFIDECCAVAESVELWEKELRTDFGGHCNNAAVARCFSYLWLGRTRPQVLACIRAGVPLHGSVDGTTYIEMCKQVLVDFAASSRIQKDPQQRLRWPSAQYLNQTKPLLPPVHQRCFSPQIHSWWRVRQTMGTMSQKSCREGGR